MCASVFGNVAQSLVTRISALLQCCYVAALLHRMGRKPRSADGEQVHTLLEPLRAARGLSRQQLADAVDVHYQTVGYLERGEYSPSLALALRIARVLEMAVEDVFSLDPLVPAQDDHPCTTT